jgi:hypothetical protein
LAIAISACERSAPADKENRAAPTAPTPAAVAPPVAPAPEVKTASVAEADRFPFVDPVAVSPSRYEVLQENDWARLLKLTLKPHEKDKLHSHPATFMYALTPLDGNEVRGDGKASKIAYAEGASVFRQPVRDIAFENTGTKPAQLLIFEVEAKAQPGPVDKDADPDAIAASPDHYKVLQENDRARLVLSTFKPGEKDKPHSLRPLVSYALTEMSGKAFIGRTQKLSQKKGESGVMDAVPSMTFENTSKSPMRSLLLELK